MALGGAPTPQAARLKAYKCIKLLHRSWNRLDLSEKFAIATHGSGNEERRFAADNTHADGIYILVSSTTELSASDNFPTWARLSKIL